MVLASDNHGDTSAGWTALSAGVRRNRNLALGSVRGEDMTRYDGALPYYIVFGDKRENRGVLSYYRAQARIRRRVAGVAVLRTAWRRSHERPVPGEEADTTRATELAHMVQLRRVCRVREGTDEVVEPFGRCMGGVPVTATCGCVPACMYCATSARQVKTAKRHDFDEE